MSRSRSSWPVVVVLVIGIGLVVAPVAFQMFSRAPDGGSMIDDFRPYMTQEQVDSFRGYLVEIGAANDESLALREELTGSGAVPESTYDQQLSSITRLNEQWDGIRSDMTDLLDRMERNLGSYDAVASLPPFPLFPWFFVVPGLAITVIAATVLWSRRHGHRAAARLWVLVALGAGLVLAPVAFQMFSRAPQGADMIDDFRPMMTRARVQDVQGYFITLGAAEGQLRNGAMPLLEQGGADSYPAIATFSADWPTIVTDFNPMIATMSDNVDNFQAVDSLPSFDLFPWFFVLPGVLVIAFALAALRGTSRQGDPS